MIAKSGPRTVIKVIGVIKSKNVCLFNLFSYFCLNRDLYKHAGVPSGYFSDTY
jgi:hypothetical protein